MPAYISENGFISLTLSAIETSIKYEANGILLGHKTGSVYYIENVIPYQLAKRTSTSTWVSPRRQKRIRRVFKNYMRYKIIGEFHTHPDGDIRLSDEDKNVARESIHELEVVVAIKKEVVHRKWHYEKGNLSGSIDKYFIEIGCWKVQEKKVTKLSIRCPFAVGFDSAKPL